MEGGEKNPICIVLRDKEGEAYTEVDNKDELIELCDLEDERQLAEPCVHDLHERVDEGYYCLQKAGRLHDSEFEL